MMDGNYQPLKRRKHIFVKGGPRPAVCKQCEAQLREPVRVNGEVTEENYHFLPEDGPVEEQAAAAQAVFDAEEKERRAVTEAAEAVRAKEREVILAGIRAEVARKELEAGGKEPVPVRKARKAPRPAAPVAPPTTLWSDYKDPIALGRPRGVAMPCGWGCGDSFTATEMRAHFSLCPRRPDRRQLPA